MLFCGQCGQHLNAGDKQCPRCGTPVEPGVPIEEDIAQDAPTVASPLLQGQMLPPTPATPPVEGNPQKLVLRPEQQGAGDSSYGTQAPYEATRRVQSEQSQGPATPGVPSEPGMGYPDDLPTQYSQNRINYPPPQDMRASYPQSGRNYAQPGVPYQNPGSQNINYPAYPVQQTRATSSARGRNVALLLILLGLLLILIAMVLFLLEHNNVFGANNGGVTSTATITGPPTREQQAQTLVQQYYDDINGKNFSAASLLWQESQRPDLASFEKGFQNTLHDAVAFNHVVAQADGTVKVSVTITATEQANDGTSANTTYTGYYIVGPQNGTWELLQGMLQRS